MAEPGIVYQLKKSGSDQAESSSANRAAGSLQMRVLIELQVISYLLHQAGGHSEDLPKIRQSVADSIT